MPGRQSALLHPTVTVAVHGQQAAPPAMLRRYICMYTSSILQVRLDLVFTQAMHEEGKKGTTAEAWTAPDTPFQHPKSGVAFVFVVAARHSSHPSSHSTCKATCRLTVYATACPAQSAQAKQSMTQNTADSRTLRCRGSDGVPRHSVPRSATATPPAQWGLHELRLL